MGSDIRYIVVIHGETYYFTTFDHMKSFLDAEKAMCVALVDRDDPFADTIEKLWAATHIYEVLLKRDITDEMFSEL